MKYRAGKVLHFHWIRHIISPAKKIIIYPCSLPSIPKNEVFRAFFFFFLLWTTSLLIKRTIFLTPRPHLCLSFQMSTANEEALRPLNLFKQRWERVYYSMLKLVDEDKHHNRSSVSVIPEGCDPETSCSLKTFIYYHTNFFFFFIFFPCTKILFPKLMALSPAFKWTQECFKGEEEA